MLQDEFQYYIDNQEALFGLYPNKHLIIKDNEVVGSFDTQMEAYNSATSRFDMGTFLLQHCTAGKDSYTQTFHSRVHFEPAH